MPLKSINQRIIENVNLTGIFESLKAKKKDGNVGDFMLLSTADSPKKLGENLSKMKSNGNFKDLTGGYLKINTLLVIRLR